MKGDFANILVVSLQGIGDLLLATPLLRGLKVAYPGSRLTVLTFETNRDVLNNNPDVGQIIVFKAAQKRNIFKILGLIGKIRSEHFDLSICAYPSGLRSALIAYLGGAGERLGQGLSLFRGFGWLFTRQVPIAKIKHAVLMNMDFLKILGIDPKGVNPEVIFHIGEEDLKFAKDFLRLNGISDSDLVIAIHAGGGELTASYRNWPLDRFAKVADVLADRYKAKIIFIGGKNDESAVNFAKKMMSQKAIVAAGKTFLGQTAALLTRARLLLCNNSGPMHIAAALNVRTVSIFGSADPRIHRPWGKDHVVLQNQLECSPCYYPFFRDTLEETKQKNSWVGKKFECKTSDYRCLTSITVDQVVEAVEHIIRGS